MLKGPNIKLVIRELQGLDPAIMDAAAKGLQRGLLITAGVVETEFLMGPRPEKLGVVTGRLKGSITTKVDASPTSITGRIGTNVPYGAYHEFGFKGTVNVAAHTRTVATFRLKKGGKMEAFDPRRAIRSDTGQVVGFKESRTRAAAKLKNVWAIQQQVKAHKRTINYRGRPFVRPALTKCEPLILREINQAIAEVKVGNP